MDSFNIPYREDQKLFKNSAVSDFASICAKEETYKETETTKWIEKHVPISVSNSSNLIPEPIFLRNSDPRPLVSSFISDLDGLATQSKAQMKLKLIKVETAIQIKLSAIVEQLKQTHNRAERASNFVDDCSVGEEKDSSTQFLQMQKNQLIDLRNTLRAIVTRCQFLVLTEQKYDINLIKSHLLPILVNEQQIEPTVIKKANQFVSFKFGGVQLLEIMNFLGGATSLDSFLKAYKTEETKRFFPYEWLNNPEKLNNKEIPPYDSFFSKLRIINPREKDYNDFQNLTTRGLSSVQAVCKLRLSKIPPTSDEN